MAKLRFIVVGSGWRSLFYWRIAQALPERFELCAMLCRTEEKAEKMHREYGVPVSTSAEQCAALHPDLVVVAVNKASIAAVSTEWLARGFAVLSETPAALEEDALRALWQLHQQGAKLQVAEQYWLYPTLAKRLAAVRSGALGTPQFARLSVAHGYHAVSLARQFLNAGQQPVRVTGAAGRKRSSKRIPAGVRCITAHWWKRPCSSTRWNLQAAARRFWILTACSTTLTCAAPTPVCRESGASCSMIHCAVWMPSESRCAVC